ncbi:unnamed protein product [Adineta steineri]|uniref:AAA+ ATPase domain-containing protein n=4 Tax=Adineta steineri TaxID=433720 RepID=A0A818RNL1_9BILA|nr:unnamed protein product [Adineta steineri]
MVDISYYVMQPIITNIKTGNIWHDYKLQLLISSTTWRRLKARYSINIIANPNRLLDTRLQVPEEYLGVLHHLHATDINICSAKSIPTSTNKSKTTNPDPLDELVNYFITSTGKQDLLIAPNIYLHIQKAAQPDPKTSIFAYQTIGLLHYKITLYSYKLTFKQLKGIITEWTVAYRDYIKEKNKGNFYHFTLMPMFGSPNAKVCINFKKHLFTTTKSFDNLFFDGKQMLIDRLNFFLNNPNFYEQRGISHSFGLLFYGSPGCGKTSTIKALASYTKRHLVEIPLSRIRTCDELEQAFFLNSYDMTNLDFSNKIIVFEDIDCMSHLIKKRSTSSTTSEPVTSTEGDNVVIHLEQDDIDTKKKKMSKQSLRSLLGEDQTAPKDPLTLSFLLNLIDGIIEQPSRILIMTSNHPEQIDPALLRPGRIDIKLEFKKCTKSISKEITEFFFDKTNLVDISQLHDNVHSPANIISACMSSTDGKQTVQLLSEQVLPNVVVEAQHILSYNEQ